MEAILQKIPNMTMRETVNLWRNAIGVLADSRKQDRHVLARKVLEAIGREWEKRVRTPHRLDDIFDWPSTDAKPGFGGLDTEEWIKQGVLQYLGYRVGNTDGEPKGVRERILTEVFKGPIPPVFPFEYLEEWGPAESVRRLQKMAETIVNQHAILTP